MISRENYIVPIRDFYTSDLIKIITGIRRCGKSVILQQVMEEISATTKNVIYLNFENIADLPDIKNGKELVDYILKKNVKDSATFFLMKSRLLKTGRTPARRSDSTTAPSLLRAPIPSFFPVNSPRN